MEGRNMKSLISGVGRKKSSSNSDETPTGTANGGESTAAHVMPLSDNTPRSDLTLPPRERRRRSSFNRQEQLHLLKDLPSLRDTSQQKRESLVQQKLQLCSLIFNFDDPNADKRGKDVKRQTLLELVDYVNTCAGQKIFTEAVMPDLVACTARNICRTLPPQLDDYDPEEDEPVLEPAWPHLQVVYEFFLRFIVSSEVNAKVAKRYVDQRFCGQVVYLFDSEDPRERDYLKTILHRIYGKFMSHRSFIRRTISNAFYSFVYETERHNGIGELLEILGSIINGFAVPLKKEHITFLRRALVPLHKPSSIGLYHQQLSYCIVQYVEKDPNTAVDIVRGLIKYWPWTNSGKQVLVLNELEEILELIGHDQVTAMADELFLHIARCVQSRHFQVSERSMILWNNEQLTSMGCLSQGYASSLLPLIFNHLHKLSSNGHWNAGVEGLAQNVLKIYMDYDIDLYERCSNDFERKEQEQAQREQEKAQRWKELTENANKS